MMETLLCCKDSWQNCNRTQIRVKPVRYNPSVAMVGSNLGEVAELLIWWERFDLNPSWLQIKVIACYQLKLLLNLTACHRSFFHSLRFLSGLQGSFLLSTPWICSWESHGGGLKKTSLQNAQDIVWRPKSGSTTWATRPAIQTVIDFSLQFCAVSNLSPSRTN